jgi:3-oxoacyl-[acyl-carrier protein] reductase
MGWWEERADLAGKVAVLTGGAGGLGLASTEDLHANGVSVAVIDRDAEACARLRELLPSAVVLTGDARDPDQLDTLFANVDDQWGQLDILVNVVGGTFRAPFSETNSKGWDALIRTNLTQVLEATSRAIPRIRRGGQGGSIINLTTIEAHRAAPNFAVYSAAKGAVVQFARSLAVELAPEGIRVNNVAPDITPTPGMMGISHDADGAALVDALGAQIALPMGRVGATTDVSNCVVFLASGLSSYVTGTTIHPDGGTMASSGWFNWPESGFANSVPPEITDMLARSND